MKTSSLSGMASSASLIDLQQDAITVAIISQRDYILEMARTLSFYPERIAASAPVSCPLIF
jgi:hypothetical protein